MKTILSILFFVFIASYLAIGIFVYEHSLSSVSAQIGVSAGLITAIGIIWKKLIAPTIATTTTHVNKITALMNDIEKVVAEFKPNGGSSIRDAINRIEARLISLERVQGALRQDGPLGIFQCTTEGKNIDVNRTYCRMLGVGKQELMGFGWRSFLASLAAREDYDNEWKDAFAEGREVEFTVAFKNTSDEILYYLIHAYPIADANNKIVQYLGILYPTDEDTYLQSSES